MMKDPEEWCGDALGGGMQHPIFWESRGRKKLHENVIYGDGADSGASSSTNGLQFDQDGGVCVFG